MLQLFADGFELPISVTGQDKPRLDASDAIEFFATPLDTPSTDTRTYYLTIGSRAGRRIGFSQGGEGKPAGAQSFPFTIERKERSIFFAALKNGDAETSSGQSSLRFPSLNRSQCAISRLRGAVTLL
jgi:hypothetical protein